MGRPVPQLKKDSERLASQQENGNRAGSCF
jgi:hypothetical protein